MTAVTLYLEPSLALFYQKLALSAGRPMEQVLTDALFMLAGELSLEALRNAPESTILS